MIDLNWEWTELPTASLLFILFYLFIMVGASASDYFCGNISTLAFHLPVSIAAILLSLANASPDLFSTFSAATNDGLNLAVGELIGSACFVVLFVAGCIGLVHPTTLHSELFIKNIGLFIILLIFIDVFIEFKTLPLAFSLLSLFYYMIYLFFILQHQNTTSDPESVISSSASAISAPVHREFSSESILDRYQSLPMLIPFVEEESIPFFNESPPAVQPVYVRYLKWLLLVLTYPIDIILKYSCPVIHRMQEMTDEDSFTMSISDLSWNSSLVRRKAQGFFGTLFVLNMIYSWADVPIIRITIILSLIFALGVSLIFDQLPLRVVLFLGVIISAAIVQNCANLMVILLKVLCERLELSQGIVGISIFALGNSLGDLVTNITLAKNHAQIAYAATLSSPVLCLAVGLGASTLYLNIKQTEEVELDPTLIWLLRLLIANLIIFFVIMRFTKYELNIKSSIYLIVSYFVVVGLSLVLGHRIN